MWPCSCNVHMQGLCGAVVYLCENVFSESTLQVKRTCKSGLRLDRNLAHILEPASGTYQHRSGRLTVQVSDWGRNGDRCRYVAGSNRSQLLPSVSILIPLPLAPDPVEGGKMGGGRGHEQHASSAPGLHGGRLPVSDAGIYVPQASHWEVWVWQGVSSQVQSGRLCPECGGQRDGGYGDYWCVLIAGGVCSCAGATADGRRCGEKPRPHR